MLLLTDEDLGKQFTSMVGRMERSAGSLETILAMIESGEGSLGALVHDPSIVQSLRDVFLGVQELGYVSNVIRNAEAKGREVASREDRTSQMQRLEAARARFLASVPLVDDAVARPVPASSKDEREDGDDRKQERDDSSDSRSKDDAE
jgi:hypothetical protein